MIFVDKEGLTNNKPANKWVKVADFIDGGTINRDAYGKYPSGEDNAQSTIRIDELKVKGDEDTKIWWCRQIDYNTPLHPDIIG